MHIGWPQGIFLVWAVTWIVFNISCNGETVRQSGIGSFFFRDIRSGNSLLGRIFRMTNLYEDDYPEGISNEPIPMPIDAPLTFWEWLCVALTALAFASAFWTGIAFIADKFGWTL